MAVRPLELCVRTLFQTIEHQVGKHARSCSLLSTGLLAPRRPDADSRDPAEDSDGEGVLHTRPPAEPFITGAAAAGSTPLGTDLAGTGRSRSAGCGPPTSVPSWRSTATCPGRGFSPVTRSTRTCLRSWSGFWPATRSARCQEPRARLATDLADSLPAAAQAPRRSAARRQRASPPPGAQRWAQDELLRVQIEAEITARDASNAATRMKNAALPVVKTLYELDRFASYSRPGPGNVRAPRMGQAVQSPNRSPRTRGHQSRPSDSGTR